VSKVLYFLANPVPKSADEGNPGCIAVAHSSTPYDDMAAGKYGQIIEERVGPKKNSGNI